MENTQVSAERVEEGKETNQESVPEPQKSPEENEKINNGNASNHGSDEDQEGPAYENNIELENNDGDKKAANKDLESLTRLDNDSATSNVETLAPEQEASKDSIDDKKEQEGCCSSGESTHDEDGSVDIEEDTRYIDVVYTKNKTYNCDSVTTELMQVG